MVNRPTQAMPPGMPAQKWDANVPKVLGWDTYESHVNKDLHIIPVNDERRHSCISGCWCAPVEMSNRRWIHNSFDRREDYEDGLRKVN
jgi:hypothetical protein